jgi:two-component system, OmpR family, sensor histidine kinase MtrB
VTDPELVARAEHELRGAATALTLACEALRRDPAASAHASVIDAQLDRLRAGLEDLEAARRDSASAEEATDPMRPEPVELPALVSAASQPWAGTAFEWEGPPLTTELDRRRFAKALGNVLANAAEHGSGDIRVTGRAHEGGVRLQVTNRGRGLVIASEAAEELGGSLSFEIVDDTAIATLDLPAA